MEMGVDHTNMHATYQVSCPAPVSPLFSAASARPPCPSSVFRPLSLPPPPPLRHSSLSPPPPPTSTAPLPDCVSHAMRTRVSTCVCQAMKELDANGDGKVDRVEFVSWMAARAVKTA